MTNDIISRNALIQHAYSAVVDGVEKDIIDLSDVDNAPTVDVLPTSFEMKKFLQEFRELKDFKREHERPQGEWKPISFQFECSLCECFCAYKANFCPNCGADMRGGAE